jgi:hypothetical protein
MRSGFLLLAGFVLALATSGAARAGSLPCDPTPDPVTGAPLCGWSISVNDVQLATGSFVIDEAGNVSLDGPAEASGTGFSATITGVSGNVDPELVFGVGATNNTGANAVFAFVFNLPLGGFGPPIASEASLGTTLTAPSDANAVVSPVLGFSKIVDSQDIRFNPFENVDKGVDIGDPLVDDAGGLGALRNELAFGSIMSGGPFDLMNVTVAFELTDRGVAGTGVGFSGRVAQIPEPGTIVLLGAGLFGLAWLRRRQV